MLSVNENVLLECLFKNSKDYKCHISVKEIFSLTNISIRNIFYLLKSLEKKGFIKKESPKGGRSNFYYIEKYPLRYNKIIPQNFIYFNKKDLCEFFKTQNKYLSEIYDLIKKRGKISDKGVEVILFYIFSETKKSNLWDLQLRKIDSLNSIITLYFHNKKKFLRKIQKVFFSSIEKYAEEGYEISDDLENLIKEIKEKTKNYHIEKLKKPKTFKTYKKKLVNCSLFKEVIEIFNKEYRRRYDRNSSAGNTGKSRGMIKNILEEYKEEISLLKQAIKYYVERWDNIKQNYNVKQSYPSFENFYFLRENLMNDAKIKIREKEEDFMGGEFK